MNTVKPIKPIRRGVERTTLGAGVLILLGLLGMVNYLSAKYYRRFDWTSAKLYTLSEKTVGVLGTVSKDIDVTLFMRPSEPLFEPVRELLERYQAASPRVHSRTVDPERNLLEAQRLSQRGVSSPNVVVFEAGEERRILDAVDLADFDYSGLQYGEQPRLTGLKAEQRFTGAILELLESRKPRILFTSGHGEISLEDASGRGLSRARSLLGRDNFDLEGWASLGKPAVPDGVDLIVVAGPTNPFTTAELAVLANYLDRGGRLLALLDPEVGRADIGGDATFVRWLSGYGVEVGDDVVVDPSNPLPIYGAETIFSSIYGIHPTTKSLRQANVPVILSLSRSVRRSDPPPLERQTVELVNTSPEGWAETDLAHLQAVTKDERDLPGPVSLAVAVGPREEAPTVDAPSKEGVSGASGMRLVVFGDSDWATDAQIANAGNATLLADVFNWLVARPQLLGIPPKTPEANRLNLGQAQLRTAFAVVLGAMPLAAILAGVWVYLRRRR